MSGFDHFDDWRAQIAGARQGQPQDWGDEGPHADELEVLLDIIESNGSRAEAQRRLDEVDP